jgi:hypothetical protein
VGLSYWFWAHLLAGRAFRRFVTVADLFRACDAAGLFGLAEIFSLETLFGLIF